ncbi:hypothetical protein C482_18884 [Natrialba chahannaoensis JCM 10990]|uniref:Uncharacterized protein n=1 Tax=Natrialba chahannaoensis JCM 10990 TaxID=1227492 RepID=M0A820_9EURY|nr:hypothetical protein [Natrialba chahannaoensis]ELY94017.1 hypothetical protein C482_18884 [Natrialba chahannaoensis JCM 10990]
MTDHDADRQADAQSPSSPSSPSSSSPARTSSATDGCTGGENGSQRDELRDAKRRAEQLHEETDISPCYQAYVDQTTRGRAVCTIYSEFTASTVQDTWIRAVGDAFISREECR